MLTLKIFLSSPGDVAAERQLAMETVRALEDSHLLRDRVNLKVVAWDDPAASVPLDALETPQASINRWGGRPSECDLTVVVLWSRLGTPLPAGLQRADGSRFASGTVWELEDAAAAGKPVFVYRRTEKPRIELDDADFDARRKQYDAVRRWCDSLRASDGALSAGINEYATPAQFQQMLRQHLEAFIGRALAASASGAPAAPNPPASPPVVQLPTPSPPAASTQVAPLRRWIVAAVAAAVVVAVLIGWRWKPGTADGAAQPPIGSVPPAMAPAQPAPQALPTVHATLPQLRLAGPAEVTFSKIRKATYTILALTPEAGGTDRWRLRVRIRLTAAPNSGGINFWDSSFRLLIDGVPRAPDANLNEIVDSGASKDADLTWDVPNGTQSLALRVQHYGESGDLPLALSGAPPAAVDSPPEAGPVALALAAARNAVFTGPPPATFTVLSVASEARRSGVYGVRVRVRMAVPAGQAANFWDDQFRLLVDGVPRAPDSHLNLTVDGGAALDGDVTFEVPDAAQSLTLRIQHAADTVADLPLKVVPAR
jgi:hypothetical protein